MSLTVSLAPESHAFSGYLCRRSSTFSSASTETVRHHGCRPSSQASLSGITRNASTDQTFSNRIVLSRPASSKSLFEMNDELNSAVVEKDCSVPVNNSAVQPESSSSAGIKPTVILDVSQNASLSSSHGRNLCSVTSETGNACEESCLAIETAEIPIFIPEDNALSESGAFARWLRTLRRRRHRLGFSQSSQYHPLLSGSNESVLEPKFPVQTHQREGQCKSSVSQSSTAFVTGVKSTFVTVDSYSQNLKGFPSVHGLLARPRRSTAASSIRRSHESSTRSNVNPYGDQITWERAAERRKILEELIESEESYIGDLKVLVNVYFTLLASVCALSSSIRASIRENVTEILNMHEELLDDLRNVIPSSEWPLTHTQDLTQSRDSRCHVRWHSADNVPTRTKNSRLARKLRHSLDIARPTRSQPVSSLSDPQLAAAVAKVFNRFASRLLAYEEYGAKYEMMVRDLAATYKTLPTGRAFEKGIEVLSNVLDSINNRKPHSKKGMGFGDLVIKPIQRICKYPLIFEALCRNTPVSDGPEAHASLEKVYYRLKEATHQVNKAKDDPRTRKLMETTWLLQDRLRFSNEMSPTVVHRVLGQLNLCGVLHVAYQSNLGIKGQYMLCALFRSCLILALNDRGFCFYNVVASIPITSISLEEADNGRGLQCHTAPFSWKLVFESDYRMFELLLSACSLVEEEQWRKHLTEHEQVEGLDTMAHDFCSLLELDLKPIGILYGQANTLARRISIHRAATLSPKSQMSQIIIKNTQSPDQIPITPSEMSLPLGRSHSILSPGHIHVLAPRRSERINLESALADVWTRDVLPFPGMKPVESAFRVSANHVMRKLSMASITSTLSKRTSSFVSFNRPESRAPTPIDFSLKVSKTRSPAYRTQPVLQHQQTHKDIRPQLKAVNFHKTPEAFLPPDFELKDPRRLKPQRQRPTIRTVEDERVNPVQISFASFDTAKSLPKSNTTMSSEIKNISKPPGRVVGTVSTVTLPLPPMNDENNNKRTTFSKPSKLTKENVHSPSKPLQPITKQLRRLFN